MSTAGPSSQREHPVEVRRDPSVKCREIAGETLLVPIRGKLAELRHLFVLNEVGAFVWDRLETDRSVAEVSQEIASHFEVSLEQAEKDLREFLESLDGAGLLEVGESR